MSPEEYLTARYDEEEAPVRDAPPGARHVDYHASDSPDTFSPSCAVCVAGWPGRDRFLADTAAKRAIVDAHGWEYADPYESWKGDDYRERYGDTRGNRNCKTCGGMASHPNFVTGVERRDSWPCKTIRLLLQPYADRPDFDPDWKISSPQSAHPHL